MTVFTVSVTSPTDVCGSIGDDSASWPKTKRLPDGALAAATANAGTVGRAKTEAPIAEYRSSSRRFRRCRFDLLGLDVVFVRAVAHRVPPLSLAHMSGLGKAGSRHGFDGRLEDDGFTRLDQTLGVGVTRRVVNLVSRAQLHQPAALQDHHAVGERGNEPEVV